MAHWMLYVAFNVLSAKTGSCQNIFGTGAISVRMFLEPEGQPQSYQKTSKSVIMNTSFLPQVPWRGFGFATVLLEKHRSFLAPSLWHLCLFWRHLGLVASSWL